MEQSPARGRPVQFDREAVVERAMVEFWRHGFDGTSLATLESATGVDRSTLYNSFGGKRGLHRAAAQRYVDVLAREMFAPLVAGTATDMADVLRFLDALDSVTRSEDFPLGCFIVNDLDSPSREHDATERYFTALDAALRAAFERAGLAPDRVEQRTRVLTAVAVGVNATAPHDRATALALVASARTLVADWQHDAPSIPPSTFPSTSPTTSPATPS